MESIVAHPSTGPTHRFPSAVDSRVGWRLPSEGKGHTFESCRVRQLFFVLQRDMQTQPATSDPAAQWTAAHKGPAFFAYSDNYLIDVKFGVIELAKKVAAAAIAEAKR